MKANFRRNRLCTCESVSRDQKLVQSYNNESFYFRERGTQAGKHAHVAAAAKGARKRSRRRGCRTAGPPRVAECEYYGTEAITRDFPFAFFDSRLFFFAYSVLSPRREGRGEREGQSLTPARASQPPRCFLAAFVRAHRCETDKEDEMDMRRRRRRRLQPGFNETGPRSVKPVQRVLCVRSRRPLSPLAQRIDGGRREGVRGR